MNFLSRLHSLRQHESGLMLFHYLRQAVASLDLLENVLYFVSNGYKNRVYSSFFVNSLKWRREGNNENGIVEIWRFCFRMRGRPLIKWGVGANLFWALECSSKKFVPFYFHHLQVNITYEYAKETLHWNQMLNF